MRTRLAAFCAWLALAGPAGAEEVAGDWLGVIRGVGGGELHLGVRLHRAENGYAGTMDSLDQGVWAVPVSDVETDGDRFAFKVPAVNGAYSGRWDAAARRWTGSWTQPAGTFPMEISASPLPPEPRVEGLEGDWDGTIVLGSARLRLILHVRSRPAGGVATQIESVDQVSTSPLTRFERDGANLALESRLLGWSFRGALSADGRSISGRWAQGATGGDLAFARRPPGASAPVVERPQDPAKPYPYREEEVVFDGGGAGVKLAGTLTLPEGRGPFPAAVLVTGSGPNTRDEPIAGHRPFLVLADHLTRRGIAVLRYDKRGTGGSTGDYGRATTRDFADDAGAALRFLRTRAEIDPGRTGLIGHSEGGAAAPMVAADDPRVAFVVLMAGPAQDGGALLTEQHRLIRKAGGASEAEIARSVEADRRSFALVRQAADPATVRDEVRRILVDGGQAEGPAEVQAGALATPWFHFFFSYDPAPTLARVKAPILALAGSKDLQVPPEANLAIMRKALAGNPDAEVVELPGLNHLFQTANTGAPAEYALIKETIAPAALELISGWIAERAGLGSGR